MKQLMYVLAFALCLEACEGNTFGGFTAKEDYVDLGLSSGTRWKSVNETSPNDNNGFYDYDEAMSIFGENLPTKEQWKELVSQGTWTWTKTWTGNGYKVTGTNGKSIFLPADGYRKCDGSVNKVGSDGFYRSSTPSGSYGAWDLNINSNGVNGDNNYRCCGLSVRLVQ